MGGRPVGIGAVRAVKAINADWTVTVNPRELEASARMQETTTIVPIAKATPTQSAGTTTFASVSFAV